MFYTAISTAGHHIYDQRVGAAVSDDLHAWRRAHPQADARALARFGEDFYAGAPAITSPADEF